MNDVPDLFGWRPPPYKPAHPVYPPGEDADNFDITGIPDDVVHLFEHLTLTVIKAGRKHYSSDAILHRIRWHHEIERGESDFKCNDHWTAHLSRWFMVVHPDHAGFFETRRRRNAALDGPAATAPRQDLNQGFSE